MSRASIRRTAALTVAVALAAPGSALAFERPAPMRLGTGLGSVGAGIGVGAVMTDSGVRGLAAVGAADRHRHR